MDSKTTEQTAVEKYVATYYGSEIPLGPVFKFQETMRVLEAHMFKLHESKSITGWLAIENIGRFWNSWPTPLPDEFQSFVESELSTFASFSQKLMKIAEGQNKNVRAVVKAIWTWPLKTFLPWKHIKGDTSTQITTCANQVAKLIQPRLKIVDGKLYLMLPGFIRAVWESARAEKIDLGTLIPEVQLRENFETEHITLINSDVLAKFDMKEVQEWVDKKAETPVECKFTEVRHTISLDWALFSVCVVIALESDALKALFTEFNEKFKATVRVPSLHVTVGIMPRMC